MTIQAEIEFKCTRNGSMFEIVDTVTGTKNLLGPTKETLIFIGTYFGNLVVYKIIPRQTAQTFGYELITIK